MILLQIASNTQVESLNLFGDDLWFYAEILVIIVILFMQIITFKNVRTRIIELREIFDYNFTIKYGFIEKIKLGKIEGDSKEIQYVDDTEEEILSERLGDVIAKLTLVETEGNNEIITRIKKTINTYLINNYGAAVNFSIIKDIIDREVEVKDEEITQTITIPLYLGLAATMVGIILGLFSMPDLNEAGFSDGVNALINGVKIAMIASLSGLFFTTFLSAKFYKNAKSKVLTEKNEQLSYLQAKLLPELIRTEDTGVSGLKASLDRFARVATTISDNVLIAANQTGENLVLQQDVMDKVENMKVLKVSKWNLELFEKLDVNMDAFNKFSTYLSNMEKISSNLLEFATRTSSIDQVIKGIDTSLSDSKQLTQFLTVHFDKIEDAGNAALKAVGIAESHFEDAIQSLKNRTDEMINQLYKSAGNHETKLEDIYKEIKENLNNITSEYISSFSEAYSNSIPKFEQLDNLTILPTIKDEISARTIEFKEDSNINTQRVIDVTNELNNSLKSLKSSLNNQAIITSIETINQNLTKRNRTNNTSVGKDKIDSNTKEDLKPKQLSLDKLFKKLFKL